MVKQGYKHTEIGVIPEDWEVRKIGEIGSFSKGKGITKSESLSGDIQAIRYGEIYTKHHNIITNYYSFISREVAKCAKQLNVGDILFAGSGETKEEIGKTVAFIDDIEAYAGGDIVILSPNKNHISAFLGYLMNSREVQIQKSANGQGDAVVHIYQRGLSEVVIPLPPLPEQQAIAEALSDADAWIASLEQLIAKKRMIKQGAMQQLLTPKDGWEVKRLGEVGKIFGGLSGKTKADFGNGNAFYIPFMNVMKNVVVDRNFLEMFNLKNGEIQNRVYKNDIIFNGSSETPEELGISSVLLVDVDDLYLNSFCFGFRIFVGDVNPLFLSYVMRSPYGRKVIFYLAQGATRYNLSKANFSDLEISVPNSLEEQIQIATILSDMDAEIESLEQQLSKARQIKQGMMQELLTGRVRLV